MSQQEETIPLAATVRTETGSGAAIRERLEGRIPGILYGADKDPVAISVERADLRTALSTEHGENALLTLTAGDETVPVIVKDLQRHTVRRTVTHIDLQRVVAAQKITVDVPLYLVGTAKDVVAEGGMVERHLSYIKVKVRADSIPERIEADISGLSIGKSLQVKDLDLGDSIKVLTEGRKAVASADLTRAAVVAQNVTEGDDEAGDAEGADETSA
ncbi:MAG: 50S ribosomal protein L25 [Candidatus Microthrix subdominans]|jgi:large subunit ribosomal protein L25|uniref:Large ribosomal subunit protein bL25 n=1 Tax=Candidatus Neomicrothrix subdominans TaxID=2954438 RepID=A0A936N9E1_9ACTN|nr:50S ribosomal protein L25 [Candidatus Microthrix sp.]MBK9295825.1 50S ribosomal protein L25 [Candidatus Microthrix subdominans]MBK6310725.1 50S ribosomal protein L25 [Candidatus Microthrix sp.]MBK6969008.1 50S ribosomal protein L25 [Candidatus Microthrix sp.]MBK9559832.1 50S ribosomal protein L25 [Candidatus Microthrix sp.]MBP7596510.1 50S ribosomal protein L25 [Candidatus Microthrix sp.]